MALSSFHCCESGEAAPPQHFAAAHDAGPTRSPHSADPVLSAGQAPGRGHSVGRAYVARGPRGGALCVLRRAGVGHTHPRRQAGCAAGRPVRAEEPGVQLRVPFVRRDSAPLQAVQASMHAPVQPCRDAWIMAGPLVHSWRCDRGVRALALVAHTTGCSHSARMQDKDSLARIILENGVNHVVHLATLLSGGRLWQEMEVLKRLCCACMHALGWSNMSGCQLCQVSALLAALHAAGCGAAPCLADHQEGPARTETNALQPSASATRSSPCA